MTARETAERHHRRDLIPLLAALLFLAYAINYLCFFVDDEGTAFVYAQNLLRGRGLSYSAFEGPVEGYSNFLQVWVGAALLQGVHLLGLPKIAVFFGGKALSLASGTALVAVVARAIRGTRAVARVPALTMLALSGPVAVWSCSSLETIPFAFLFTAFVVTLLEGSSCRTRVAVALGAAAMLARIDGFVFVGAAWAAAFLSWPAPDRRRLFTQIGLPLAAAFAIYNGWRYWYFGSLLSLPLQAKVLYKLLPADAIVTYAPETGYLARFLEHYHPAVLAPLALGWLPFWRWGDDRRPLMLLVVAAAVGGYVAVVGDWMFGFRLFTPVIPLLALLAAFSFDAVVRRAPRVGTVCAIAAIVWSTMAARTFVGMYEHADRVGTWQSWWTHPTFEPAPFFSPYYALYAEARDMLPPGTVTVNNQAGFLPFMLDLENIDDLGLCSRFFATLPTADVIFTEVGRYHALTPRPALRAGEAYLLFREPEYLITERRLLRTANQGRVPEELLGGHFRLILQSDFQAIYTRTDLRVPDLTIESFRENLAHPASLRMAARDGVPINRADLATALPFLVTNVGEYPFDGSVRFEFHLPDDPVFEIWLDGVTSSTDADLRLSLRGAEDTAPIREGLTLQAGRAVRYRRELDRPVRNGTLVLEVATRDGRPASLILNDLRLLGQTPALRAHVSNELFR
jgi:hypothetical protein